MLAAAFPVELGPECQCIFPYERQRRLLLSWAKAGKDSIESQGKR